MDSISDSTFSSWISSCRTGDFMRSFANPSLRLLGRIDDSGSVNSSIAEASGDSTHCPDEFSDFAIVPVQSIGSSFNLCS